MFLLKLIRKLGKLVRGGAASRQIFLGALLGVLIGMIPGFNLSVVIAALLLLVLNAHIGIALMGFALGKILMYLLAPVTFHTGYFLIHSTGMAGLFQTLVNTPGLALLDLHVYSLLGGIPFAVVIGIFFAWIMNKAVQELRRGIIEATGHSERMKKLAANRLVRFFLWIVFGKKKEDIRDMLQKSPPLFRKGGLGLAAAVLLIGIALEFLLLDAFLAAGLKKGLEAANRAEVNLAEADFSLAGGRLQVRGLQVTDPANPSHNSFEAERLSVDLSLKELLRKRYVLDLLAADKVSFNSRRTSTGRVFVKPPARPPEEEKTAVDYLEKARTLRNYLSRLQKYLEKIRSRSQMERKAGQGQKKELIDTARYQGYLDLSAKELLADHPVWLIRRAEADGVAVPGLSRSQYIEGKNLSSHPERLQETMALIMADSPEARPTGALKFNFHDPAVMHELVLRLHGLSLEDGAFLSQEAPVIIREGQADLDLEGRFSSREIDVPFSVALDKLHIRSRQGRSVLGMDPATTEKVFESVDSFKLVGRVSGFLDSPRLELDTAETLASLKSALAAAGKEKLRQEAEKQVGKATGKLKEKAGEKVTEGIGGLLDSGPGKEGEERDSTVDRIKGLF